jgi:uncharacterized membrane protein
MKNKAILVSFIALFAIVFALSAVIADDFVTIDEIEVNGIDIADLNDPAIIGVDVSETVPVVVQFTAPSDGDADTRYEIDDVRVKVYVEGYRDNIEVETSRFHILEGNTYTKRLTLTLPSSMDLDDLSENVNLLVRVSAKSEDSVEEFIPLEVQKDTYSLNLLSVDATDVTVSGDEVSVDVVVQNNGNERLDNIYIEASIPELGTSRKVYVGDLIPQRDWNDDQINDATSKRVYLTIPRSAAAGTYDMVIEVFNYETSSTDTVRVAIRDVDTGIMPSSSSKTVAPGAETSFDLVLVNPSNRMVVYTITPEETRGLIVDVTEPVVAVAAGSSRTVDIDVRATDGTEEGTYLFTVNANSDDAESQPVTFSLNVEKDADSKKLGSIGGTDGRTNTTVVLTVVLVIVFVVLLIVLIVLLTKRPAESEEFGETNYY